MRTFATTALLVATACLAGCANGDEPGPNSPLRELTPEDAEKTAQVLNPPPQVKDVRAQGRAVTFTVIDPERDASDALTATLVTDGENVGQWQDVPPGRQTTLEIPAGAKTVQVVARDDTSIAKGDTITVK